VVLTSQTTPYSATILNIPETNSKFGTPSHPITVSVSNKLMSMAAFPNHQLFLLDSSGNVQSLQFAATTQQPSSVILPQPLANPLPLSISARSFSFNTDVPVPAQQTSSSLTLSPTTSPTIFLVSDQVNNAPHLYIVDDVDHRVIVLQNASTQATPTASVTATKQPAQQATATGTATATAAPTPTVASSGQSGAAPTMSLVQQYVSGELSTSVEGVASNPKIPQLFLLTTNGQNAAGMNLAAVDVSQQNVCAS
jgi:hypothetical protein